jgi:hypothetical protein
MAADLQRQHEFDFPWAKGMVRLTTQTWKRNELKEAADQVPDLFVGEKLSAGWPSSRHFEIAAGWGDRLVRHFMPRDLALGDHIIFAGIGITQSLLWRDVELTVNGGGDPLGVDEAASGTIRFVEERP